MAGIVRVVVVMAIVMAAGVGGCGKKAAGPETPAAPAVQVRLAPVVRGPLDRTVPLTGTLFGREEATLSAKVSGRVAEIVRDVGDAAPSGEVVIQIDRIEYKLALAEREAALLAALAKLGLSKPPPGDFDASHVPTVQRARAEAANAAAKLERARQLFEQTPPLISEQDFADIQTQAEVAAQGAEVELLNANATLAEAQTNSATIAIAEQHLADTSVRAPTPMFQQTLVYRVSERLVSVGEFVNVGQALARVVAADIVKFRGEVPEQFAGQVSIGQSVTLAVEAFREKFAGKVTRVAPRIDPKTRTFEVEIEIPNEDGRLKPGAFARASIVVGTDDGVTLVPADAVVTFAGVRRVFSVKDGKAVEHRVETGVSRDGLVEILGGLKVDEVVVAGAKALAPDRAVELASGKQ